MNGSQATISISFMLFVAAITLLILSFGKEAACFAIALSFGSGYYLKMYYDLKEKTSGDKPQ
jgi:hypothetical protein